MYFPTSSKYLPTFYQVRLISLKVELSGTDFSEDVHFPVSVFLQKHEAIKDIHVV